MTTTVDETWAVRELPLLRELVAQIDAYPRTPISVRDAATAISMDHTDAERALRRLRAGEYVADVPGAPRRNGDGPLDRRLDVTEKALHATGAWPTPETALDRMLVELHRLADDADEDDETRTRARKILDGFAGAGRQIGIAVIGSAITGGISQ